MKTISELNGFNMERILVKYSHGYITTGYYKDGLILLDGNKTQRLWSNPNEFDSFILLSDVGKMDNEIKELNKELDECYRTIESESPYCS